MTQPSQPAPAGIERPREMTPTPERVPVRMDRVRLFLASFLMLFVELVLIRWSGANVVYLSFFSNFVLLGSFLGIGLGFLLGSARWNLFRWAPVILATFITITRVFHVTINRSGSQLIFFGAFRPEGLPIWLTLPIVFAVVALTMVAIAQGVAKLFATFPPLDAYRLDILGSIAGIAAFGTLSLLGAGPVWWAIVIAILFALILHPNVTALQAVAVLAVIAVFGSDGLTAGVTWSPYYRITTVAYPPSVAGGIIDISVNGIPHQSITTLDYRRAVEPTYFQVYQQMQGNPLNDVLIIGAGSGTDTAIALSEGAKHIDAVEIDPKLYQLGRDLNPAHPYQNPRVDVHIGDGRAFLQSTDQTYDLILFALPDSLTLVAGQSSLRLESYLFTEQAMQEAKAHLKPGGTFAMYNYYREQWLVDRLANTLQVVYGHAPCADILPRFGHLAVLSISPDPSALSCAVHWTPGDPPVAPPATDDYPFLYLRTRTIPSLYLITLALILAVSLAAVRAVSGPLGAMRRFLDLFFMGAAFLLLETKNVVQFALLFGTTWFVNALVFGGILLTVLLAIEVARRVHLRRPATLYVALAGALAVTYVVPASSLLGLATVPRFFAATALAFAPVFVANLVFAERFQNVESSTVAFGANLLGAMVGGAMEYSALVIGYRSLLIVAAALYGLAFLTGRRYLGARAA